MSNIKLLDSLHVIDVSRQSVSPETLDYLTCNFVEYKDQRHHEDLISIGNAVEDIDEDDTRLAREYLHLREAISAEVKELQQLANEHDAAYVRFTYN